MKKNTIIFTILMTTIGFFSCKQDEPDLKAQSISLSKTELSLAQGDSVTITADVLPAGANPILAWTSSNEKVATVVNGKIKTFARGTATIKVTADSVFNATCAILVTREDLPFELVWSDEFNGTTLDLTKWSYETGGNGFGNQEKQYYTNRPENLRFENGSLVIEAKKEAYLTNNYTSARINTRDKVSFAYGKIEARISLPVGKGTWPAFWMMGSNISFARWPLCGEIDIMEHIGSKPTMISHATHTTEKNGSKGNNWHYQKTVADVESNYHTYAIEWEEKANEGDDNMSFLIDGVKSATIWEPHVNATAQQWPFKSDFFIILNLAIGGTMGGAIDDAMFDNPVMLKVDYVRVYQRK